MWTKDSETDATTRWKLARDRFGRCSKNIFIQRNDGLHHISAARVEELVFEKVKRREVNGRTEDLVKIREEERVKVFEI